MPGFSAYPLFFRLPLSTVPMPAAPISIMAVHKANWLSYSVGRNSLLPSWQRSPLYTIDNVTCLSDTNIIVIIIPAASK